MTWDNLPCPRPKATNFYNSVYSSLPCNYPDTPCQLKNDNLPVSQPRRITFGYTLTSYGVSTSLHFPNRAVHYIREKTASPLPPLFRGRETGMMRKAAFRHVHSHIPPSIQRSPRLPQSPPENSLTAITQIYRPVRGRRSGRERGRRIISHTAADALSFSFVLMRESKVRAFSEKRKSAKMRQRQRVTFMEIEIRSLGQMSAFDFEKIPCEKYGSFYSAKIVRRHSAERDKGRRRSRALPLKPPYTGEEGKGGEKRGGNFPLPLSPLNPASKAVRLCYQRQAREKRSLMSHRRRCHPSSFFFSLRVRK